MFIGNLSIEGSRETPTCRNKKAYFWLRQTQILSPGRAVLLPLLPSLPLPSLPVSAHTEHPPSPPPHLPTLQPSLALPSLRLIPSVIRCSVQQQHEPTVPPFSPSSLLTSSFPLFLFSCSLSSSIDHLLFPRHLDTSTPATRQLDPASRHLDASTPRHRHLLRSRRLSLSPRGNLASPPPAKGRVHELPPHHTSTAIPPSSQHQQAQCLVDSSKPPCPFPSPPLAPSSTQSLSSVIAGPTADARARRRRTSL